MNFWKYVKNIIQDTSEQESKSQQSSEESSQEQESDSQQSSEEASQEQESKSQQSSEESSQEQESESQQSSEETSQEQESKSQQSSEETSQEQESKSQQSSEESSQEQESKSQQSSEESSQEQESDSQQSSEETSQEQESKSQQSSEETSQEQESKSQQSSEESSQEQESKSQQSSEESFQEQESNSQQSSEKTSQNQDNESQKDNQQNSLEERKEKLQQLKDKIQEYADKKRKQEELQKQDLERTHLSQEHMESEESTEEEYQLNEQTNHFLEQLSELPPFENRDKGPGYSIDTNGYTEIPDSVIKTLITKFLNQRFCKHNTDLNIRSNSLEKSKGFYKWEVKDVITHLQTHQITKVLDDKYGYEYANGKNENVPLSFYFDMSGSMSNYTNMLSVIAIELLKKNVKVLIGFNERVNVQIDKITKNIDVSELAEILDSAGYYSYGEWDRQSSFKKDPRVSYKFINQNLDNYLISKKAEKCVVFSDFDPIDEVINLSHSSDVYWFCFESSFDRTDLKQFHGFIYKVRNIKDLMAGLIKVNEKRFEALCYVDNPKTLQRKIGG